MPHYFLLFETPLNIIKVYVLYYGQKGVGAKPQPTVALYSMTTVKGVGAIS
jgi:hypothetical protein